MCDQNIDDTENSCINGTCIDGLDGYTCDCDLGYEGETCDENIDHCEENGCINGTCIDGLEGYTCDCNEGYSGEMCDTADTETDTDTEEPECTFTIHDNHPEPSAHSPTSFTMPFCDIHEPTNISIQGDSDHDHTVSLDFWIIELMHVGESVSVVSTTDEGHSHNIDISSVQCRYRYVDINDGVNGFCRSDGTKPPNFSGNGYIPEVCMHGCDEYGID
eukprot:UN31315